MNGNYVVELKQLKKDLEKENVDIKDYLLYDISKKLDKLSEDTELDEIEY